MDPAYVMPFRQALADVCTREGIPLPPYTMHPVAQRGLFVVTLHLQLTDTERIPFTAQGVDYDQAGEECARQALVLLTQTRGVHVEDVHRQEVDHLRHQNTQLQQHTAHLERQLHRSQTSRVHYRQRYRQMARAYGQQYEPAPGSEADSSQGSISGTPSAYFDGGQAAETGQADSVPAPEYSVGQPDDSGYCCG